jgi:membrane protease YdiL (CAAX protease family)
MASALLIIPPVWLIQVIAVQFIDYTHPTLDSLIENFTFRSAVFSWIAAVAVAPVAEEFFFRGVIQGWLQRVFDHDEPKEIWFSGGQPDPNLARDLQKEFPVQKLLRFWSPILITSLAFAAVHAEQGPAPIPLFFLSMGIGYVFRKTGSFWPCVVVHLVLNSISMIVLTLTILYPELQPPVEVDPIPAMYR